MGVVFDLLLDKFETFLLVLVRTSGIFIVSPFFSSQNVPNSLKAGFSFILSILLTLSLDISLVILETTFVVLVVKELMVGLIIGFISYAFFSTFYVMGQIIDMKIGFGMVNVIDPQHRVQIPVMGNFYYILAFLLLLSINGHHSIINGLMDSYEFIPIGGFAFNIEIGFFLTDILSQSFITGFKLSAPIVGTIFLTDLLLGILARTIPQMNVFVVGLPLKILIGLIIIGVSIPIFYSIT
ncbi:flagellar biosynthetic protein FliR, partial [Schnuerera sp.]|uniref:flagellar biosynthetic protein FliR n=1 Tax=Schnuerera sp. TaxID=2794844 RepID=UPI002BA22894